MFTPVVRAAVAAAVPSTSKTSRRVAIRRPLSYWGAASLVVGFADE
jgi:hypothetical protein